MLPVLEKDGRWTGRIVLASSLVLVPVTLLPYYLRIAGRGYGIGAVILDLALVLFSMRFVWALPGDSSKSDRCARTLLRGKQPRLGSMIVEDYIRPAAIASGVITDDCPRFGSTI